VLADVGIVRLKREWASRAASAEAKRAQPRDRAKGCGGRRPVKVTVDNPGALALAVLLFAAFVVRGLGEDGSAEAGAAASGA